MLVDLTGNLLGRRDHTLRALGLAAHPDDDETACIGPAISLHHTGNDLALVSRELTEGALVLSVAKSLQHHLPRGSGRDSSETLRGVLILAEHNAVFVDLAGEHLHRTGFAVDFDVRLRLMALGVPVCAEHSGFDVLEQLVEGDSSLHHDRMQ